MSKFGNLFFAGLTSGGIYAVFALCLALWYRVSGILNLAVGDFAMLGALGVDRLCHGHHWSLAPGIIVVLVLIGVFAFLFDLVVLRAALDKRHQSGVIVIFFYTFALSFFIEGSAKQIFGTDVRGAPPLWPGGALSVGGVHIQRAGVLVIAVAAVSGLAIAAYLKFTLSGKAMSAAGQNKIGAGLIGIDHKRFRRGIFVLTALLAGLFGVLESPLNGFVYTTGATISLTGVIASAFAGFVRPGKAVIAGLVIGILEAFLGGYINTQYGQTILFGILAAVVLIRPEIMGLGRTEIA